MPPSANPSALAQQARRWYAERLLQGMPAVVQAVDLGARVLAGAVAEPRVATRHRDVLKEFQSVAPGWLRGMTTLLRGAVQSGVLSASLPGDLPPPSNRQAKLT